MDQQIEASGRVVRDPELKTTAKGKMFARVTVAADDVQLNGERVDPEQNKWQTAVFWDKEAKSIAETVRQGDRVKVAGEVKVREYQDRNGETKTSQELHDAKLEVIEKMRERGTAVEVVGNVVRAPELKTTANGKTFARVSVAADEVKLDGKPADPEQHKWHTAILWDKDASAAADKLKKGTSIRLSGEQVTREYEDKNGDKKSSQELHRAKFELLERSQGRRSEKAKGEELSR